MSAKLNLIAAACHNMGIGKNGDLPWRLKSEMAHFTRLTSQTKDPKKKNAVIMGRVSWDCIPLKFRPLKDRLNVVLSRNPGLDLSDDKDVVTFTSLDEAVQTLSSPRYENIVEKIWVIGGSHVYKLAMDSQFSCRLYLTKILKEFDCDTFFPEIPTNFHTVSDPDIPQEIQEEKGIQFKYTVLEKC